MGDSRRIAFHNQEIIWGSKDDSGEAKMQALWRSVIMQALIDAASNSKKRIDKLNRARAIEWLKYSDEDFIEVCTLANMDPDYVRYNAQKAMDRGCKWRNDLRTISPITIDKSIISKKQRNIKTTNVRT